MSIEVPLPYILTLLLFCVSLIPAKMPTISDRILNLQDEIGRVCGAAGRNPGEITVVGVTKFAAVGDIRAAVASGLKDIGESRVQVAQEKFAQLQGLPVRRHLIGHLQTNKVKAALELFDLIQSVDSLHLAEEIQKQAEKRAKKVDVLIQVDCAGEEQKFGVAKDEALFLAEQAARLPALSIQGLMTMAPFTDDETVIRNCFRDLRRLFEQLRQQFAGAAGVEMRYLSMGMSHDYRIALEEGANMLRIGTAIFGGKRP